MFKDKVRSSFGKIKASEKFKVNAYAKATGQPRKGINKTQIIEIASTAAVIILVVTLVVVGVTRKKNGSGPYAEASSRPTVSHTKCQTPTPTATASESAVKTPDVTAEPILKSKNITSADLLKVTGDMSVNQILMTLGRVNDIGSGRSIYHYIVDENMPLYINTVDHDSAYGVSGAELLAQIEEIRKIKLMYIDYAFKDPALNAAAKARLLEMQCQIDGRYGGNLVVRIDFDNDKSRMGYEMIGYLSDRTMATTEYHYPDPVGIYVVFGSEFMSMRDASKREDENINLWLYSPGNVMKLTTDKNKEEFINNIALIKAKMDAEYTPETAVRSVSSDLIKGLRVAWDEIEMYNYLGSTKKYIINGNTYYEYLLDGKTKITFVVGWAKYNAYSGEEFLSLVDNSISNDLFIVESASIRARQFNCSMHDGTPISIRIRSKTQLDDFIQTYDVKMTYQDLLNTYDDEYFKDKSLCVYVYGGSQTNQTLMSMTVDSVIAFTISNRIIINPVVLISKYYGMMIEVNNTALPDTDIINVTIDRTVPEYY